MAMKLWSITGTVFQVYTEWGYNTYQLNKNNRFTGVKDLDLGSVTKMAGSTLSISEINNLSSEEFILRLGNVVEHCALVAAAVWMYRPFQDVQHLINCFNEFLDQLPQSGKEGVLRLHPDLAGTLAKEGGLTQESTREQAAAGLHEMTSDERQRISSMNEKYKNKFGFPFVICARENKKASILAGLEARLRNSTEEETKTGVNEVKKICRLRLFDIIVDRKQGSTGCKM